jgi:hypothetical protein
MPAEAYNLEADTEYTLATIAVDGEGKYGEVKTFVYKTLGVSFSETFKLSIAQQAIAAPFDAATKGMFKFTTEGGTATHVYYFNFTADEAADWGGDEAIAKELVLNENWSRKTINMATQLDENGCYTITNLKTGTEYTLYAVAFDGENYSKLQKVTYTPTLNATIIPATDAKWEASKPTVTVNSVEPAGYSYTVNYTVTPAAATKVDGGHFNNIYTNGKGAAELVTYMMTAMDSYHYVKAIETAQTYEKTFNITSAAIWVTWCDAEGNYYEPIKVAITAAE